MSVPVNKNRDSGGSTSGNTSDISGVISAIKVINEKTDVLSDDVSKTVQDTHEMMKVLKKYYESSSKKDNNDGSVQRDSGNGTQNKVCKIYGCIYKGTYDGIVDGLKAVKESEQLEKIEKARIDNNKRMLSDATKLTYKVPLAIGEAIIGLLDFRKSEILNLVEAIRYGGRWKGTSVDYSQEAWKVITSEAKQRKKGGNVVHDQEDIGLQTIELLKGIKEGVGAQKRGFFNMWRVSFLKYQMTEARYQIKLLEEIGRNTKPFADRGLFSFFKRRQSQTDILNDIRENTRPREKENLSLWRKLNTPILQLFKKPDPMGFEERTASGIENIYNALENDQTYKTNYINTLGTIAKNTHANAIYAKRINERTINGVTTVPFNFGILTPYEADVLSSLKDIDERNFSEYEAILGIGESICSCIMNNRKIDSSRDIFNSMEATRHENVKQSMNDAEERREGHRQEMNLQRSVDGIYGLMRDQGRGAGKLPPELGVVASLYNKASSGLGLLGNIAEIKEGFFSKVQEVKYANDKQIVSLSDSTLEKLEDIFDDDGMFDMFKKKKKGGGLLAKGKGLFGRGVDKGKGLLTKGKGAAGSALSKGRGLGQAGLAALPGVGAMLTGGMGLGGLLSASGTAIAGAGAGAMTGAAGLVGLAGAAGYGVGSLINKGLDSAISSATGGGSSSLGDLFYNLTHRKEAQEEKQQEQKLEKLRAQNTKKREELAKKNKLLSLSSTRLIDQAVTSNEMVSQLRNASKEEIVQMGKEYREELKSVLGKSSDNIKDRAFEAAQITKNATLDMVEKGRDMDIPYLAEMKATIEAIRDSKTAGALKQSYNEAATAISNTTNINVPIMAHDTDRATNLLNDAFGA